jgi:hypothetical protein
LESACNALVALVPPSAIGSGAARGVTTVFMILILL